MGLNLNEVKTLVDLHKKGVKFSSVVMLGHQNLLCEKEELKDLLTGAGFAGPDFAPMLREDLTYIDPLLKFLGAETIDALDYSEYEGATIIQDLNAPLAPQWKERYDLVIDGGTIEHVFNVPEALRTCMELCRQGGYVFLTNPANNQCGHGFYQFSPELMFRVFAEENGFEIERVVMSEILPRNRYRSREMRAVRDPADIGIRVTLDAGVAMQMIAVARRTAIKPIFQQSPLQSDYNAVWNEFDTVDKTASRKWRGPDVKIDWKRKLIYSLDRKYPRLMAAARTLADPLKNDGFYK